MDKVNTNTQLPNLTDMKFQLKETTVTLFSFNILVLKILNTMKITTLKKLLLKLHLNTESILKLALKSKFITGPKTETKLLYLSYLWLITNSNILMSSLTNYNQTCGIPLQDSKLNMIQ